MKTADLFDQYEGSVQVCDTQFKLFGNKKTCFGQIVTLKCFEDNSLVKKTLGESGQNKILVVDGGGSLRRALLGDIIAESAIHNGWEGVIIYGCIRDSIEINTMDIHVKCLGTNPHKSTKSDLGLKNIPIQFGGVFFHPEHWLYSDPDGILLSPTPFAS